MNEEEKKVEIKRFDLPIVQQLEDHCKCGFFCECKEDPEILDPLFRLCVEGKPAVPEEGIEEDPPVVICPWTSMQSLIMMLQGALFLQPLIMKVIKEHNGNAEKPAE